MDDIKEAHKEAKYFQNSFLYLLLKFIGFYKRPVHQMPKLAHVAAERIKKSFRFTWPSQEEKHEREECYRVFADELCNSLKQDLE